jgi:Pentapeptide repeats (8 copies)
VSDTTDTQAPVRGADVEDYLLNWSYDDDGRVHDLDLRDLDFTSTEDWESQSFANCDLRGCCFRGLDLRGGDFEGCKLDGADFTHAQIKGCHFTRSSVQGVIGLPVFSDAPERLRAVAEIIRDGKGELDMDVWHYCSTSHCIAGWGIHLAGAKGALMEEEHGPSTAGLMLLGVEAATHFFDDNEDGLAFLEEVLARPIDPTPTSTTEAS